MQDTVGDGEQLERRNVASRAMSPWHNPEWTSHERLCSRNQGRTGVLDFQILVDDRAEMRLLSSRMSVYRRLVDSEVEAKPKLGMFFTRFGALGASAASQTSKRAGILNFKTREYQLRTFHPSRHSTFPKTGDADLVLETVADPILSRCPRGSLITTAYSAPLQSAEVSARVHLLV